MSGKVECLNTLEAIARGYLLYCEEKRAMKENPLPYVNWLELELQAFLELYAGG